MLRVFSGRLKLRKWDHGGAVRSCKERSLQDLLAILMWVLLDLDLKFNIYIAQASRMDTASCFRRRDPRGTKDRSFV